MFNVSCGAQQLLNRIADRWTALLICALNKGPLRYSQLERRIEGISEKMLTRTLRKMELDGLVFRHVFAVIPPRVEYSLTPMGRSLLKPFQAMCHWAERHMEATPSRRSKRTTREKR